MGSSYFCFRVLTNFFTMTNSFTFQKLFVSLFFLSISYAGLSQLTYPIVDTDVSDHYSTTAIISATSEGDTFHGQDASYNGNQPSYTDNGDGTITDNVTGLMWEQDMGDKISYDEAITKATNSTLGGYTDWRVPTIKELYSLALFTGRCMGETVVDKFINTNYFNQPIGDTGAGEREIDAQTWSITEYTSTTMNNDATVFGYNFVDGRLKGYPKYDPQTGDPRSMYFRMVRGNTSYGINQFVDNGDGTITDNATGLMWQQADDGTTRNWENALAYAENLTLAGHSDWRMPNAKELQSIVDYSRSPDATNSPAIDPLFTCTSINDPDGNPGYGYYWTGSPLMDGPDPYSDAVYICFGEAQGQMEAPPGSGNYALMDTHGAGAQRNDPKTGSASDYPDYFGPQNDVRYVFNYTRCVRSSNTSTINEKTHLNFNIYPNPAHEEIVISASDVIKSIQMYNTLGHLIFETSVGEKTSFLNTTSFSNGIYLIQLISDNGAVTQRKILVQN